MKISRSITNLFTKDKILVILLVVLSSALALDPFFHKGIFTAHDIEQNIARFGAFQQSFFEGHLFPHWAKDLAQGYGGPILMLSYSVPYYLALPFRLFGLSLVDCIKILNLLTLVGSACLMYLFLRSHFHSFPSFLGSLFYVFAPYRISNIYARGSIPENTAFVFVPLAAFFLFRYWSRPTVRSIAFLAFSFSLIILSHPFFGIITAPFFLGYIFYLFHRDKSWQKLGGVILAVILTVGLTAYFTLPLLIESKYTHFDIGPFRTTYKTEGINLSQLTLPQWSFVDRTGKIEHQTWQLGVLNIGIFLFSFFILFLASLKEKVFLGLGIFLFILASLLSLKISLPLYELIKPLQHVQFPWRFLALNVISLSLLGSAIFSIMERKFKNHLYLLGIAIIFLLLILNLPFAHGYNYQAKTDKYYLYEMVTNTEGPATQPRWSAQPETYTKKTKQIEIIEGDGKIREISISSTLHTYEIEANTPLYLVDNTFYFPGWRVKVDRKEVPIEFQNPSYRGLITFKISPGEHFIEVSFGNTKLRLLAKVISGTTAILVFFLIILGEVNIPKLVSRLLHRDI